MAISSPLLEDIDLSGARGVLVNITAGFVTVWMSSKPWVTLSVLSLDNATVVIGTS